MNLSISNTPKTIGESSENMRFGAAVTAWGLLMRDSKYKGNLTQQQVIDLASNAIVFDPHNFRQEFVNLVKKVKL
jgi:Ca-activated chloride channel family protein